MLDRATIENEFKKYFTNRPLTDNDVANAQKYGLGIFKSSAEQIKSSGRSLDNTLTDTANRSLDTTSVANPNPRSIEDQRTQLTDFQSVLRKATLLARSQRPTPQQDIQSYLGTGPVTPQAAAGALDLGTASRLEVEKTAFGGIVDVIKAQEDRLNEQQQANLQFAGNMLDLITKNPTLLASLTGPEFESLKSGVVSTETMQKIGEVAQNQPQEGFTLSPGQVRYDAQGNPVAYVPDTSGSDTSGSEPTLKVIDGKTYEWSPVNQEWVAPIVSGKPEANAVRISALQQKKAALDSIVGNWLGMTTSVGTFAFNPFGDDRTGVNPAARARFKADVEFLTENMTLEKLLEVKAAGGSFGALSDSELGILSRSASKINSWKILDKKGNWTGGLRVSEKDFLSEVKRIDALTEAAMLREQGYQPPTNFDLNTDAGINGFLDLLNSHQALPKKDNSAENILNSIDKGGTPVGYAPQGGGISLQNSSRLARVNNNPGNLRYIGQQAARAGEGGFARFETPDAGWNALVSDIYAKQTGASRTGLLPTSTLADLISVYAPPSENDTVTYIRQASQALGIPPTTKISQINTLSLAKFIALKESSTIIA